MKMKEAHMKKNSQDLPEIGPVRHSEPEPNAVRITSKQPSLWLIVLTGFVVGIGLLMFGFFVWKSISHKTVPEQEIGMAPTPTPVPEERSFTAVLVGYGGAGHDGASLTDSILVARYLFDQHRIILLSVPRDTWVQVATDRGQQSLKMNAVYALHGPEELKQVLSQITGWKVENYFGVDFRGFTQAIDTLGGVELTVERAFDDYEYPITGRERLVCDEERDEETGEVLATPEPAPDDGVTSVADEISAGTLDRETLPENVKKYPCRYEHLRFAAGKQTLTGVQALKYARSRHSAQDGNDFNRARRQQNLIRSLGVQVLSTNSLSKIPSLISTLRSHTATDLSALHIADWIARAPSLRDAEITSVVLTDKNYLQSGHSADRQFILQPKAGIFSWQAIQNWLDFISDSQQTLDAPVIEVLSPPAHSLLAQEFVAALASQSASSVVQVRTVPLGRNATASATVRPLVPRVAPEILESLQHFFSAELDTSKISTESAQLNGPHVEVVWE